MKEFRKYILCAPGRSYSRRRLSKGINEENKDKTWHLAECANLGEHGVKSQLCSQARLE